MSIISSTHDVEVYEAGKSKAFEGQRLSKHSWKTPKNEDGTLGVKPESKCVSIPKIPAAVIEEVKLQAHILNFLEGIQDAMIKELILNGKTQIADAQIDVDAMIEFLEASNEGGRLTKKDAEEWFVQQIEDTLALTLAAKLGVGEVPTQNESDKIFKIVGEFKSKVSSLAGGKTSYAPEIAKNLQKCLELVEDKEDPIYVRFSARLNKMIETKEVDLLDLL